MYKLSPVLILTLTLAAPVFVSNNPRSIYSDDPRDPWNRIFGALFTRVELNLTKAEASKKIDELQQKTGRGVD